MPAHRALALLCIVAAEYYAVGVSNQDCAQAKGNSLLQVSDKRVSSHAGTMSLVNSPTCQCIANDPAWDTSVAKFQTKLRDPKCIFIDLGAADGNTFWTFMKGGAGPVEHCPSGGQWEAYLVEANPQFKEPLKNLEAQFPGKVHSFHSTAAWSCDSTTSFYIDNDVVHDHWGSSMNENAQGVVSSGPERQQVTVPTINVVQLIAETVMPEDYVVLKVDIESAEYNVIPCLAQFNNASLVDTMYMEEHYWFTSVTDADKAAMAENKMKLISMGVVIPPYFSPTL